MEEGVLEVIQPPNLARRGSFKSPVGFGINRPDGKRTPPSAMNWQDMDIYVILPNGLYLYDAKANQLNLILAEDLRGLAGTQPYVKEAPVNLIYVSDYAKMGATHRMNSKSFSLVPMRDSFQRMYTSTMVPI
jgi:hypothetical protein